MLVLFIKKYDFIAKDILILRIIFYAFLGAQTKHIGYE